MTAPTQAQIEAAAKAICKSATCEGINCCQWPSNGSKRRDHLGQAVECNVAKGAYDAAAIAALTAAAQVAEPPGHTDLMVSPEGIDRYLEVEAATIERCAQEVESVGGDNAEYHAAAIRKLKDET
jgi:hypothetical protein